MIRPTKENIDKCLGEGIYGRLPVINARYLCVIMQFRIFLFPIVWPICKITGYTYSDYMDDRYYLIALDPQGLHIYCEDIEPNKQFIKFTEMNKLYVRHGILGSLILTIKTRDNRRYKITQTGYLSSNFDPRPQQADVKLFYESLKSLEESINSGKYQ